VRPDPYRERRTEYREYRNIETVEDTQHAVSRVAGGGRPAWPLPNMSV